MIYISRRVEFCASHRLCNPNFSEQENWETYGRCTNPSGHGHNYVLEVVLRGSIEPKTGMLMDLKALKQLIEREIIERVDHKNLNVDVDFMEGVIPTAENMVVSFWNLLQDKLPPNCELHEMRLWETDNNMAFYRGEGAEIVRHRKAKAGAAGSGA
jgi:6-pyruvoyltetrahydropterin/6-carboxytetrahydropterin synthase